jgi:hypothetical protein
MPNIYVHLYTPCTTPRQRMHQCTLRYIDSRPQFPFYIFSIQQYHAARCRIASRCRRHSVVTWMPNAQSTRQPGSMSARTITPAGSATDTARQRNVGHERGSINPGQSSNTASNNSTTSRRRTTATPTTTINKWTGDGKVA